MADHLQEKYGLTWSRSDLFVVDVVDLLVVVRQLVRVGVTT